MARRQVVGTIEKEEIKFNKEQIVKSTGFSYIEKDILKSVLTDEEKYSFEEVKKIISDFKQKEVK